MLGGVTREQELALREYGFHLGIAFQLVDDLLDYTADEDALGKPVGGDLREGKVTLPAIYLLQRDGGAARELIPDRGPGTYDHARILAAAVTIARGSPRARECLWEGGGTRDDCQAVSRRVPTHS